MGELVQQAGGGAASGGPAGQQQHPYSATRRPPSPILAALSSNVSPSLPSSVASSFSPSFPCSSSYPCGTPGLCVKYRIPFVILSASIQDVMEEMMEVHGVQVANSNSGHGQQGNSGSQVYILANRCIWASSAHSSNPSASTSAASAMATPAMSRRSSPIPHLHPSLSPPVPTAVSSSCSPSPLSHSSSALVGFDHSHLIHTLNKSYHHLFSLPQTVVEHIMTHKTSVILMAASVADMKAMQEGMERREGGGEGHQQQHDMQQPFPHHPHHHHSLDGSYVQVESNSSSSAHHQHQHQSFPQSHSQSHNGSRRGSRMSSSSDLAASFYHVPHNAHPAAAPSSPSRSPPFCSPSPSVSYSPIRHVLRVGLLNDRVVHEDRVREMKQMCDVIIRNDGDLQVVHDIVAFICGDRED